MSISKKGCELKPKQRLLNSFKAAFNGIGAGLKCERNFKIHLVVAVLTLVLMYLLHSSYLEWAVIILTIIVVMSLELVNTALEKLIDFLNPDIHPTIKIVKDMVGGAVLIAALGAVAIGCLVILPKIIEKIS